ncbi:MAG: hypothetical protein ACM30H_09435 [Clostridia bacterium]
MRTLAFLAAALLLASCATFDTRDLQPGASESQVVAQLGQPTLKLPAAGGVTEYFYSLQPEGRRTYAAVIGSDGVLKALEQRLEPKFLNQVVTGMTAEQVRELLGPPWKITHFVFKNQDVWEYKWLLAEEKRVFWVGFAPDGKVAEVVNIHDYESDPPSGPSDFS